MRLKEIFLLSTNTPALNVYNQTVKINTAAASPSPTVSFRSNRNYLFIVSAGFPVAGSYTKSQNAYR